MLFFFFFFFFSFLFLKLFFRCFLFYWLVGCFLFPFFFRWTIPFPPSQNVKVKKKREGDRTERGWLNRKHHSQTALTDLNLDNNGIHELDPLVLPSVSRWAMASCSLFVFVLSCPAFFLSFLLCFIFFHFFLVRSIFVWSYSSFCQLSFVFATVISFCVHFFGLICLFIFSDCVVLPRRRSASLDCRCGTTPSGRFRCEWRCWRDWKNCFSTATPSPALRRGWSRKERSRWWTSSPSTTATKERTRPIETNAFGRTASLPSARKREAPKDRSSSRDAAIPSVFPLPLSPSLSLPPSLPLSSPLSLPRCLRKSNPFLQVVFLRISFFK